MIDRKKTWVLVMNSTVARILRGFRDGDFTPPAELVLKSPHRNLREIMADKPGRSFASVGGGRRSAMDYASDPLREDLYAFVRKAVVLLQSHYLAGDFTALAIFAEPSVLGVIRGELGDRLRSHTILEAHRNLLHLNEADLARVVLDALQSA
jgi:protein required for attachment to host cells